MKIFYFLLLCHFLLLKTAGGINESDISDSSCNEYDCSNEESNLSSSGSESSDIDSDTSVPKSDISISDSDASACKFDKSSDCELDEESALPDVKISLVSSPDHSDYLHFKQTDGLLANVHLPVWTMTKNVGEKSKCSRKGLKLTRKLNVMKQLGKFTLYQDPKTNSAAVYFHRRRQFDGIIDYRYVIRGLSVERIHPGSKTKIPLGEYGVTARSRSIAHPKIMQTSDNDGVQSDRNKYEIRTTYGNRLYDGYPEVLVVVSYDLAQKILKNSEKSEGFTAIVSYVLTLFNGVDMLYSNLKETNIKLNIAGIIIATESDSLAFLHDCYGELESENTNDQSMWLDAVCAMRKIRIFLYNHMKTIPLELYDLTVFLTGHNMYTTKNEDSVKVLGHSGYLNSYETRKENEYPILVAAVQDNGEYESHMTIAHELAHMMSVLHDLPPFITNKEECCGYIMKPASNWCQNCLSWSETSENAFKLFFSSADCCPFINKPQSLYPPGRKMTLTADEQCQCYGYKFTKSFEESRDDYCETKLQCVDDDDEIHDTAIPYYGTPCYYDKVCWNWKCEKITNFKFTVKSREALPEPSNTLN